MTQHEISDKNAVSATALAQETADAMLNRDAASKLLGLRLAEIRPGYARLTMLVRADMLNSHRTCHGGLIFTLADSAFAYACNSYNRNTVASACQIDFLAPVKIGETLEAECEERSLTGRTGIYDTTVRSSNGTVVALFRGKSHRVSGEVIAELQSAASSNA